MPLLVPRRARSKEGIVGVADATVHRSLEEGLLQFLIEDDVFCVDEPAALELSDESPERAVQPVLQRKKRLSGESRHPEPRRVGGAVAPPVRASPPPRQSPPPRHSPALSPPKVAAPPVGSRPRMGTRRRRTLLQASPSSPPQEKEPPASQEAQGQEPPPSSQASHPRKHSHSPRPKAPEARAHRVPPPPPRPPWSNRFEDGYSDVEPGQAASGQAVSGQAVSGSPFRSAAYSMKRLYMPSSTDRTRRMPLSARGERVVKQAELFRQRDNSQKARHQSQEARPKGGVVLPPLGDMAIEAWRLRVADTALRFARKSDVPPGMLPRLGAFSLSQCAGSHSPDKGRRRTGGPAIDVGK
mmetsp:Transcript_64929/g.141518  ORF Transcript_64929/g.141518 Transcript_64929/m.141518 type:complete len:355 (+) Transcript_64929:92-1156(+)